MIITALVAGATAKLKDVASQAVAESYEGLKCLILRKLGKGGAVQSVEDDPQSEPARATLAEALAGKSLQHDAELQESAGRLHRTISDAEAAGEQGAGDIDIETVHGHVNATVEKLVAAGRIRRGPVVADTGDAKVSDLATVAAKKKDSWDG